MVSGKPGYHHGDLRRALLDEAIAVIAMEGLGALSLRGLARRIGVSHAAPTHHFGDKTGLITALAAEGFTMLADASEAAMARTGSFLEVGVAYVRFAIDHPAHFEVMFRPELHHLESGELVSAKERAWAQLHPPAARLAGEDLVSSQAGLAAWALVHGLVSLWRNDALPPGLGDDPEALTRSIASYLFSDDR